MAELGGRITEQDSLWLKRQRSFFISHFPSFLHSHCTARRVIGRRRLASNGAAARLVPARPSTLVWIGKPPIFALDQVALVINLGDSVERAQCASCGRQGVASEWRHGLRCQAANEDRPQNVARCGIREGTGGYAAGLMFMDVEPMFAGICEVRDDQGA